MTSVWTFMKEDAWQMGYDETVPPTLLPKLRLSIFIYFWKVNIHILELKKDFGYHAFFWKNLQMAVFIYLIFNI